MKEVNNYTCSAHCDIHLYDDSRSFKQVNAQ